MYKAMKPLTQAKHIKHKMTLFLHYITTLLVSLQSPVPAAPRDTDPTASFDNSVLSSSQQFNKKQEVLSNKQYIRMKQYHLRFNVFCFLCTDLI